MSYSASRRDRWITMAVVLGGSYLFVLDLTVLGVALPAISADLGGGAGEGLGVDWIITAYVIAVSIVQPATGWFADRFGKKQVFLAALLAFTAGSLLAGLAPNLPALVAARVIQGAGGGAMMPVGMAMVFEMFPADRRGSALGMWGVAIMAAPALGPPAGGWVISRFSWHWIFLVNVPVGILVAVVGWRILRDVGQRDRRPLHWQGWLLAGLGVLGVVLASRQASDWGVTDPLTIGVFVAGGLLLAAAVVVSRRHPNPIIEFRMFAVRTFSVSIVLVMLLRAAQFARLTFLPIELQVVRGLGPDQVGLLLAPGALGVAATMWLGGWLADRIGARIPVVVGAALVAGSGWFLANLEPTTPLPHLVGILVVSGLGTGLALIPNSVAGLNALPGKFVAQATAVRAVTREVATAVATAALSAVVVLRLGAVAPESLAPAEVAAAQDTYNLVFFVAFVLIVGTFGMAFLLPGRARTREHHAARAAEQGAAAS